MKRYFVNIAAAMLLAACSGNKASDAEGQAADNTEKADSHWRLTECQVPLMWPTVLRLME